MCHKTVLGGFISICVNGPWTPEHAEKADDKKQINILDARESLTKDV